MALILSIDTAIETATICFSKNEQVIDCAINKTQKDHASFLQVAIKKLAAKNNIDLKDLDALAVTAGPGSYTGLRVGLASAKGICFALNKPLITLNTLQVLAQAALLANIEVINKDELLICPMIDARRMEVFTALYNKNLEEIITPQALILTANSFEEILSKNPVLFIGNGAKKINVFNKHSNVFSYEIEIAANSLSYLSYQSYVNQQFANLSYAEPFYLKPFIDQKIV